MRNEIEAKAWKLADKFRGSDPSNWYVVWKYA